MHLLQLQMRQWCSYLHVAEKNSIAKSVSNILSQGTQRVGSTESMYNQVYQFKMNGEEHVFSSVTGHLFSKRLPDFCDDWQQYDNSLLLTREVPIQIYLAQNMKPVAKNLQQLAKKATRLVLWLDCDREGEAIAFEVIRIIKAIQPTIAIDRATFLAVTKPDIFHAYTHLKPPNPREADAVNYRQELDFRTGCAFTRFQTVAMQKQLRCKTGVISYGLCQIPTLSIVVDRYLEIIHFKPEKYWTIECICVINEQASVDFKWEKKNVRDQIEANMTYARIYQQASVGQGLIGKVTGRKVSLKTKPRPYPLTTIEFQKTVSNKLKMSAAKAMELAEGLYQKGYISYPRTQTNSFPSSMNIRELANKFINSEHGDYVEKLKDIYRQPKKGKQSDQAHVPIHPVKVAKKGDLSSQEYKIYDFILRHFLACCSPDAVANLSEVFADVGQEAFRASYLSIKEKNYLEIYVYENWTETAFAAQVPDIFNVLLKLEQNSTKAPSYLTESDLIGKMQINHIGTDSTIHQHIQTIQHRKYAVKENTTFRPTNLGVSLVLSYRAFNFQLAQCRLRRQIQEQMDLIAEGKIDKETAVIASLQKFQPMLLRLVQKQRDWAQIMVQAMNDHSRLGKVEFNDSQTSARNQSQFQKPQDSTDSMKQIKKKTQKKNNSAQPKKPRKKKGEKKDAVNKNNENVNNKTYTCFTCGKSGHISPNCPNKYDK